jgi:NAD(P)-dependent dehydrogenase (short-subunit alcohol dehydrogenase family)
MDNQPKKPVAVITGVGPGLGASFVRRFAATYAVAMLARKSGLSQSTRPRDPARRSHLILKVSSRRRKLPMRRNPFHPGRGNMGIRCTHDAYDLRVTHKPDSASHRDRQYLFAHAGGVGTVFRNAR